MNSDDAPFFGGVDWREEIEVIDVEGCGNDVVATGGSAVVSTTFLIRFCFLSRNPDDVFSLGEVIGDGLASTMKMVAEMIGEVGASKAGASKAAMRKPEEEAHENVEGRVNDI